VVAVRIDSGLGRECLVMRGQVARLCQESDGSWTVGLEVLRYLRPGEAPKLTEHLANHGIDDTGSGEAP
jgi:hypothetical protein